MQLTGRIETGTPFRFAIDRASTNRGSGVVVTGAVASGRTSVGDRLVLASTGHSAGSAACTSRTRPRTKRLSATAPR